MIEIAMVVAQGKDTVLTADWFEPDEFQRQIKCAQDLHKQAVVEAQARRRAGQPNMAKCLERYAAIAAKAQTILEEEETRYTTTGKTLYIKELSTPRARAAKEAEFNWRRKEQEKKQAAVQKEFGIKMNDYKT